jgi:MFS family permease
MVLPDLPEYLGSIGGREYNWLIIPVFATFALLTRPFSGKFSDTAGRVFVMAVGAIITTIACGLYLFIPIIWLFFVNRAFHGFCAGFTPTGFTAYADDIVPIQKRGEAMGIVGICNNIGNASGWVIGSKITNIFGIEAMFLMSSAMGLISFFMFISLKETIPNKQKFSLKMLKINRHELIERRVFKPGVILLLTAFSSGAILALIADFTNFIGIKNKGMYMGIYIISSIITRFLAGRWSDKYGRKIIALIGSIVLGISMLLLSFTSEIIMYSLSSITFGIGFGLISPSLFAWAADLAVPGFKGKAVGTLFIFMELGIIIGSSVTGLMYNNKPENFFLAFLLCAILAFLPVVILSLHSKRKAWKLSLDKT